LQGRGKRLPRLRRASHSRTRPHQPPPRLRGHSLLTRTSSRATVHAKMEDIMHTQSTSPRTHPLSHQFPAQHFGQHQRRTDGYLESCPQTLRKPRWLTCNLFGSCPVPGAKHPETTANCTSRATFWAIKKPSPSPPKARWLRPTLAASATEGAMVFQRKVSALFLVAARNNAPPVRAGRCRLLCNTRSDESDRSARIRRPVWQRGDDG
jgi:hypothetical protein